MGEEPAKAGVVVRKGGVLVRLRIQCRQVALFFFSRKSIGRRYLRVLQTGALFGPGSRMVEC